MRERHRIQHILPLGILVCDAGLGREERNVFVGLGASLSPGAHVLPVFDERYVNHESVVEGQGFVVVEIPCLEGDGGLTVLEFSGRNGEGELGGLLEYGGLILAYHDLVDVVQILAGERNALADGGLFEGICVEYGHIAYHLDGGSLGERCVYLAGAVEVAQGDAGVLRLHIRHLDHDFIVARYKNLGLMAFGLAFGGEENGSNGTQSGSGNEHLVPHLGFGLKQGCGDDGLGEGAVESLRGDSVSCRIHQLDNSGSDSVHDFYGHTGVGHLLDNIHLDVADVGFGDVVQVFTCNCHYSTHGSRFRAEGLDDRSDDLDFVDADLVAGGENCGRRYHQQIKESFHNSNSPDSGRRFY